MKLADEKLAVIGLSCRFPGASNYIQFWDNIVTGKNSISEIPHSRMRDFYSSNRSEINKSICKWAGLLDQINAFDRKFFNVSPQEAKYIDSQQRILLEETWHCFEDAGISLSCLHKANTAVYVAAMTLDYLQTLIDAKEIVDRYTFIGNCESTLANRLSYQFNLTGESFSINGACAGSLVALHQARRALLTCESDYAVVAATNIICHPLKYISFSKAGMLSDDGFCKTFDSRANGYVPGEGIAVILLTTLDRAIRQNHRILGVIANSACNHNGSTSSISHPCLHAQQALLKTAYPDFKINPNFIEMHGTGTNLGDPIEFQAIKSVLISRLSEDCFLGSVKANIGHLEAAAGLAGLIKVIMMFKHKIIPPQVNVNNVNPLIMLQDTPFKIATSPKSWHVEDGQPAIAGISSFGFGGANAHVVLESFTANSTKIKRFDSYGVEIPFILSAKSETALDILCTQWIALIDKKMMQESNLMSICSTLAVTRSQFDFRLGGLVKCVADIRQLLEQKVFAVRRNDKQLLLVKQQVPFLKQIEQAFTTNDNQITEYPPQAIPIMPSNQSVEIQSTQYYTFLQQCNELYQHQHTFKSLVTFWHNLGKKYDLDLLFLLSTELQLPIHANEIIVLSREQVILMLSLSASMRKLKKIWQLEEIPEINHSSINQLLLVLENLVLSEVQLIEVILRGDTLATMSHNFTSDNSYLVVIGETDPELLPFQPTVSIANNNDLMSFFLQCWMEGINLQWDTILDPLPTSDFPLPSYPFDATVCVI